METNNTPVIYWVLQDNQVTPFIIDFLELIRFRIRKFIHLKFLIPAVSTEALKVAEKLKPKPFQVTSMASEDSYEGYCRKRDQLGDSNFSEGLKFWRTLLLDDLGSGNLYQAKIHAPQETNVAGIILQIPTPLGSAEIEERIFYSWVHLAKINHVPIIGYELLPLCTRWTLAPSIVDGIITNRQESYSYLTGSRAMLENKIWLLPRYEGKFFSPATTPLWRNGMGMLYTYQNDSGFDLQKTILYIPHNVAMTYEYKTLLNHLKSLGNHLHLMFSIGKDQVRGAHNHQQIIETVCRDDLKNFSYSLHDLNRPAEITMADAVVACSECYTTEVSTVNGIPTFVFDPMVHPHTRGHKTTTNSARELVRHITTIIQSHNEKTEISQIMLAILKKQVISQGAQNE